MSVSIQRLKQKLIPFIALIPYFCMLLIDMIYIVSVCITLIAIYYAIVIFGNIDAGMINRLYQFYIFSILPESSRQGVGTGLASSNFAASHYYES